LLLALDSQQKQASSTMMEASHKKSPSFHSHQSSSRLSLVLWYIAFGALHELAHIATAVACGLSNLNMNGILQYNDGWIPLLYRVLLGRHVVLPALEYSYDEFLVRHAGWIFSIVLATVLSKASSSAKFAARITALEALATDLLRLPILAGIGISHPTSTTSHASAVFCCGNFGVILLHHLWLTEQGKNALDCLEQMVKVTMMRGAQSGGVITYAPNSSGGFKGIRSRVLNKKRTDLSVEVRRKVQRDVFGGLVTKRNRFPEDHVVAMLGHTRFATSSKSSFEGTHPHRWTPASLRRVYDLDIPHNPPGENQFNHQHVHNIRTIPVENFITHNGDFDFYEVNGKIYDLETIQKWLVVVTGAPMPAAVDSCAVAGVVDLLRTQGCFGLSARYTICIGLKTSKPQGTLSSDDFPSYAHFETIGTVFEQVLGEMLENRSTSNTSLVSIGDSPEVRHSFALRVLTQLQDTLSLIRPLEHYLFNDEEGDDATLLHFCLGTIDAFFDNDLFWTTKTFLKHAKGSFGLCIASSLDAHRQICLAARGQPVSVFMIILEMQCNCYIISMVQKFNNMRLSVFRCRLPFIPTRVSFATDPSKPQSRPV
jgi:hypothetical protein